MKQLEPLNILLTWELGGGLGHLARLRPVAEALKQRGHRVVLATGHLQNVDRLPGWLEVLPAPRLAAAAPANRIREPASFADILLNEGFASPSALSGAVRAWRNLLSRVGPDVVVQDYSPLALLALQGLDIPTMLLGTGFACPPNQHPLPDIRAWQNHYPERIQQTESEVLNALNRQLEAQFQDPLGGIGELFTRVSRNCLATLPGLDHYPGRKLSNDSAAEYVGVWSDLGGSSPAWPDGAGPRIFAYLKAFRGLPHLLDHLAASDAACLVFSPGGAVAARWNKGNIRVTDSPLDMSEVATQCDMAILHAGHGSTARMLLAGKPVLQIPFNVEQYHTAKNSERLGAGIAAFADKTEQILAGVNRLMEDTELRRSASAFARANAGFDPDHACDAVVEKIEKLAAGSR